MSAASASRIAWIDQLRGLAVIGMIETHAVNTFLDSSFETTNWLQILRSYDGLIAPGFLWIAGYVQGLAIRRNIELQRAVISAARLRRLGLIALIGYLMHLPWGYWISGDFSAETWRMFWQTDILQCLAVSLVTLMVIGQMARGRFETVLMIVFVIVIAVSPLAAHWHTGIAGVDTWLNNETGSLFPLFPWCGFAFVGALFARSKPSIKVLLPLGLGFIFAGKHFAPEHFYVQNPAFFFERLGWLLIFVGIVWADREMLDTAVALQLAGREALLMYVAHLAIIYAIPFGGQPLDKRIGHTLSRPAVASVFLILLALCYALAWLNERRKVRARLDPSTLR